ncbi:MAG: aldo/keto reductase, partial [Planctomycetales bacterium]|nr:aldo/keto reductase [Planctomycetales bacterium]
GINFIDTAPDYGVSEERIGRFISHRRDQFYLATKCGCAYKQHDDHLEVIHEWKPDVVQRNVELSLRRLQTDYIDLLQFHGGDAETLKNAGLIDQLLDLKEAGTIRLVGISSKIPDLADLIALNVFDAFQIPYSCLTPEHHDLITQAAESGAGIIIRGGIAQGGPDAEIQRPALNDVWGSAGLDAILPEGMLRAELILRYTLTHPHCHTTIVGTCNPEHLNQNVAAIEAGPLPDDLYEGIRDRVGIALRVV